MKMSNLYSVSLDILIILSQYDRKKIALIDRLKNKNETFLAFVCLLIENFMDKKIRISFRKIRSDAPSQEKSNGGIFILKKSRIRLQHQSFPEQDYHFHCN